MLRPLSAQNGKPGCMTSVSRSDVNNGWRDRRAEGGVVMDVEKNDVVAENLSMPHSPRLHKNKLWMLNSGTGDFGYVDRKAGDKGVGAKIR